MADSRQYWVFDWLDKYGIRDLERARALLSQEGPLNALRELADSYAPATTECMGAAARFSASILAGRGIDLSGHLDCGAEECRRRQVDDLFHRVWFYFDKIVVADAIRHEVSCHWQESTPRLINWLLSHIGVLLYLKKIGAEALVEFREKPVPCEKHWREHAQEAGLAEVLGRVGRLVPTLLEEGDLILKSTPKGCIDFSFTHPSFEHTQWGHLCSSEPLPKDPVQIRLAAGEAIVRRFVAHLASDVAAAQAGSLPLGSTLYLYRRLLDQPVGDPVARIAFDLQLPIIENIPTAALVRIRQDEHEYFKRFQFRLRQAIEERRRLGSGAEAIAKEIETDLIEPELQRLRDRLVASERALSKKAAVGMALGALATTCGVLSGLPLPVALGAGVGTVVTMTGTAASKHIEEERDASLEDLYFLWKAVQHVHQ